MLDVKPTVLVVEDEAGVRTLISTILRLADLDVLACGDCEEALGLARSHAGYVDLVITDVNLGPASGGPELAAMLRTLFPSMPILYMSGSDDDEAVHVEVDGGQAHFLPKPFTPKSLTEKVLAILSDKLRPARLHPALP